MNGEAKTLAACIASREAFNIVSPFVEPEDFSESGKFLFSEIQNYYILDPDAKSCDYATLKARCRAKVMPKQADNFDAICDNLATLPISPQNASADFLLHKRGAAGAKLAQAILSLQPETTIAPLLERYTAVMSATELKPKGEEVSDDWEELFKVETDTTTKIPILPRSLNARIGGGVRRGDSVLVVGRPNCGKSLFCINAAAGFLRSGLKVLWCENEERGNRTKLRLAKRVLGWNDTQIQQQPALAALTLRATIGDRFIYQSLYPGTPVEIERLVIRHRPDVLVLNQIRNINTKGENFTRSLDSAAQAIRVIGKRHNCVTLAVTQAKSPGVDYQGNPRERTVLTQDDIDSSHTGMPGAYDLIIGYGITQQLRNDKKACLSLAKSKFGGDGEHFYVGVDPEHDKLSSLEKHTP